MKTFILCLFFLSSSAFAGNGYPQVFFSYSWLYDDVTCPKIVVDGKEENQVKLAWMDELEERTPQFQKAWDEQSVLLFETLFKRFSGRFSRKEVTGTFSLCPAKGFPSYSDPLILKMGIYLKSFRGNRSVFPVEDFVELVFHELLHTWVHENLKRSESPMLKKYAVEKAAVRAHLHLMALQKYVYQQSGRLDLLKMIEENYPQMPAAYVRAWEIVNLEGDEAFLKELKEN